MIHIDKTNVIILLSILVFGIILGAYLKQPEVKIVVKEIEVGTSEPINIADTIRGECPKAEIIQEVGCVDEINTTGKVRVDAGIVEKKNTKTGLYEEVKTIIEFNQLIK